MVSKMCGYEAGFTRHERLPRRIFQLIHTSAGRIVCFSIYMFWQQQTETVALAAVAERSCLLLTAIADMADIFRNNGFGNRSCVLLLL